jgi:hypothetical protein
MCAASKIRRGLQQGLASEFLEDSQGKRQEWKLIAATLALLICEVALVLAE